VGLGELPVHHPSEHLRAIRGADVCSDGGASVQQRAMRDGIAGNHGNAGIMESVSYRFHWTRNGSNPTLSANIRSFVSIT
jgi:hypothetical protein